MHWEQYLPDVFVILPRRCPSKGMRRIVITPYFTVYGNSEEHSLQEVYFFKDSQYHFISEGTRALAKKNHDNSIEIIAYDFQINDGRFNIKSVIDKFHDSLERIWKYCSSNKND